MIGSHFEPLRRTLPAGSFFNGDLDVGHTLHFHTNVTEGVAER